MQLLIVLDIKLLNPWLVHLPYIFRVGLRLLSSTSSPRQDRGDIGCTSSRPVILGIESGDRAGNLRVIVHYRLATSIEIYRREKWDLANLAS